MNSDLKFTVVIPVYKNDNADYFMEAISSIVEQSVSPNEIVIVVDGPVPDLLEKCIEVFVSESTLEVNVIRVNQSKGLGNALNIGIRSSKYNYIARMDSDDVSLHNRFELELQEFIKNPDLCVVGGQIEEFTENVENVVSKRKVPTTKDSIIKFAHKRNPMNHMTVMFKKDKVQSVGGYHSVIGYEDYDLWIRMLQENSVLTNIDQTIVKVRIDNNFSDRRGGWMYLKRSLAAKYTFKKIGFYTMSDFMYSVVASVGFSLIPSGLRMSLYKKILRK